MAAMTERATDVVIHAVDGVWLVADGLEWVSGRVEDSATKVADFGHWVLNRWADLVDGGVGER